MGKIKLNNLLPIFTAPDRGRNNIGDTFIGIGIQYLVERVVELPQWLIVNKYNENETKELWPYIKEAGCMVFGGMPQYHNFNQGTFWHDDVLWAEMIDKSDVKVLNIAGGAGNQGPNITPDEFVRYCHRGGDKTKEFLKYRKEHSVLTTVRDEFAQKLLVDAGIESHHLPCGAAFSSRYHNIEPAKDREYIALVLSQVGTMSLDSLPREYRAKIHQFADSLSRDDSIVDKKTPLQKFENETRKSFWLESFLSLYKNLKVDHKIKVVCHERHEFDLIKSLIPISDIFFSTDYSAVLKFYAHCHTVISSRLHGSLPAYGIPGTKVVNISVDVRGNSVKILPKIQTMSLDDLSIINVRTAMSLAQPSESKDLDKYLLQYDELISQGFNKLAPK
jgi:hypothetical protein